MAHVQAENRLKSFWGAVSNRFSVSLVSLSPRKSVFQSIFCGFFCSSSFSLNALERRVWWWYLEDNMNDTTSYLNNSSHHNFLCVSFRFLGYEPQFQHAVHTHSNVVYTHTFANWTRYLFQCSSKYVCKTMEMVKNVNHRQEKKATLNDNTNGEYVLPKWWLVAWIRFGDFVFVSSDYFCNGWFTLVETQFLAKPTKIVTNCCVFFFALWASERSKTEIWFRLH